MTIAKDMMVNDGIRARELRLIDQKVKLKHCKLQNEQTLMWYWWHQMLSRQ